MYTEETKNNDIEITKEDFVRVVDLEEILGITKSTYYKDIEYLNIKIKKDNNNCAWISNHDLQRIKELRKYVKDNGRRNGFEDLERGNLIVSNNNNITKSSNRKNEIQSNQEIYVEPENPTENIDTDYLVRKGAELKARELAMPHLVVRAIADEITEEELPEDLQQNVEDAREVASPKFTPADIASSILKSYRRNLA